MMDANCSTNWTDFVKKEENLTALAPSNSSRTFKVRTSNAKVIWMQVHACLFSYGENKRYSQIKRTAKDITVLTIEVVPVLVSGRGTPNDRL